MNQEQAPSLLLYRWRWWRASYLRRRQYGFLNKSFNLLIWTLSWLKFVEGGHDLYWKRQLWVKWWQLRDELLEYLTITQLLLQWKGNMQDCNSCNPSLIPRWLKIIFPVWKFENMPYFYFQQLRVWVANFFNPVCPPGYLQTYRNPGYGKKCQRPIDKKFSLLWN